MKIFAINGNALAGKDSFVYKVRAFEPRIRCISTIDPIKDVYASFFGWDGIKTDESRRMLNQLKSIWIKTSNGPSNWVSDIIDVAVGDSEFLFIMVREFDEMDGIVKLGRSKGIETKTIRIIRPGLPVPPIEQEFMDQHPKSYRYDWVIVNHTTEDPELPELASAASQFVDITNSMLNGRRLMFDTDYDKYPFIYYAQAL